MRFCLIHIFTVFMFQSSGFALEFIAHRGGGEGVLKPSSIAAFQYSVQNGIRILESDMHLTKDNRIVLAHDPILLGNKNNVISQMTIDQVLNVEELTTLEQIYGLYKTNPEIKFQLEIKYLNPWEKNKTELYKSKDETVKTIIEQIENLGLQDVITIASFDQDILLAVRKLNPSIKLKYNYRGIYFGNYLGNISVCQKFCFWPKWDQAIQFTQDNKIEIFAPSFQLITNPVLKTLNPISDIVKKTSTADLGFQIHVWTVNDFKDLEKIDQYKVNAIITDYPILFKKSYSNMSLGNTL